MGQQGKGKAFSTGAHAAKGELQPSCSLPAGPCPASRAAWDVRCMEQSKGSVQYLTNTLHGHWERRMPWLGVSGRSPRSAGGGG